MYHAFIRDVRLPGPSYNPNGIQRCIFEYFLACHEQIVMDAKLNNKVLGIGEWWVGLRPSWTVILSQTA